MRALSAARRVTFGLATLSLVGCSQPIDPEELREQDALACEEAGFESESDAYRLCLLIQENNRRMAYIERRLDHIELDLHRFNHFPFRRHHD